MEVESKENIENSIDFKIVIHSFLKNKRFLYLLSLIYLILFSLFSSKIKPKWSGSFIMQVDNIKDELTFNLKNKSTLNDYENIYQKCFFSYNTNDIYFILKNYETITKKRDQIKLELPGDSNIIVAKYRNINDKKTLNILNQASNDYINYLYSISSKCINDLYITNNEKSSEIVLKENEKKQIIPIKIISPPKIYGESSNNIFKLFITYYFALIFLGLIIILISENLKERLYNLCDFKKYINYLFLDKLFRGNSGMNKLIIKNSLIKLSIKESSTIDYKFIFISDDHQINPKTLRKTFKPEVIKKSYFFYDLQKLDNFAQKNKKDLILILPSGCISKKFIHIIINIFNQKSNQIKGWFFLENF